MKYLFVPWRTKLGKVLPNWLGKILIVVNVWCELSKSRSVRQAHLASRAVLAMKVKPSIIIKNKNTETENKVRSEYLQAFMNKHLFFSKNSEKYIFLLFRMNLNRNFSRKLHKDDRGCEHPQAGVGRQLGAFPGQKSMRVGKKKDFQTYIKVHIS